MRNAPRIEVAVQPEGSPKIRIDVSDLVIGFEYEDCEKKADKLSLTINNWDLRFFDDPIFRKGNRVHVSWGYAEAMAVTRICQIRKVTGFQQLKIEALGREIELNVETKLRVFEGMSRSDVALQIAREWGFVDEESLHIQRTKLVREHVAQARQTDAQLLRRLAAKEGFEWYIDHDGFHFHERNFFQRSIRVLTWFSDPDASEIQEISIENDVTRRAGSVNLRTHSPVNRRSIDIDASLLTDKQRANLGSVVDAPGKTEKKIPGFKSIAHHAIISTTEEDEDAAKRQASAALRSSQQRAVKMTLVIEGDPNIQAKSVIEVRGIGVRLSQRYYVRTATHSISGAYTTKIECVSDGTGGHTTKSVLAHEASAVNPGPKLQGKRPPVIRRGIDIDPSLKGAPPEQPKELTPVTKPDGSAAYVKPGPEGVPGNASESSSAVLMSEVNYSPPPAPVAASESSPGQSVDAPASTSAVALNSPERVGEEIERYQEFLKGNG